MSEQAPQHSYEVQWEGSNGSLRSETVDGDYHHTDPEHNALEVWYDDADEPHLEISGLPFMIQTQDE